MYEAIKLVLDGRISKEEAAVRLGVSTKTVGRRITAYICKGYEGLAHRSRGRIAHNELDLSIWHKVIFLYKTKYEDYNWTHFHQKLTEVEGIKVAYGTLYNLLRSEGFVSPRAQKKPPRKNEHPSRARRSAFGELVQIDASLHAWFGDKKAQLHLAIDDAASEVLAGHFAAQETLDGYLQLFSQILSIYGVPQEFYADRRTVFSSVKTTDARLDLDISTQFRVAAAKVGVKKIHVSSVPQAKGRIERAFQTFQDRLVSEMRSAKITTIDEANAFLPAFIADHNRRYALDRTQIPCAFGAKLSQDEINIYLSKVCERKVSSGLTVSYKGKDYAPYDEVGKILLKPGTQVHVLKALNNLLYLSCREHLWILREAQSGKLPRAENLEDKVWLPPKNHPWKEESYRMLIKKYRRAG